MRAPYRAMIVEDEAPARRRIRALLEEETGFEVAGQASTASEAIGLLSATDPDILFLDIRLRGDSGFDVLEALDPEDPPLVVFVTAHDEHAVRAFDVGAVDYLLKPFEEGRFRAALERIRRRLDRGDGVRIRELLEMLEEVKPGSPSYPRRLGIRSEGRILYVEVDEILWIEAADYYARLHLPEESHLMRTSLRKLEERLDPERFVRVHRSAIVRIDRVRELRSTFRGDAIAVLDEGTRIRVSRRFRAELERRLASS